MWFIVLNVHYDKTRWPDFYHLHKFNLKIIWLPICFAMHLYLTVLCFLDNHIDFLLGVAGLHSPVHLVSQHRHVPPWLPQLFKGYEANNVTGWGDMVHHCMSPIYIPLHQTLLFIMQLPMLNKITHVLWFVLIVLVQMTYQFAPVVVIAPLK